MSDPLPIVGGEVPEVEPTAEDDQYGSGVDHEPGDTLNPPQATRQPRSAPSDDGPEHEPTLPAWVDLDDDAAARALDDLPTVRSTRCPDCLDESDLDLARACYQHPVFRAPTVWYQLAARHGLRRVDSDRRVTVLVAPDGLRVEPTGQSIDPSADRPYLSYLDVSGPAGAVEAFVGGLLDAADHIKRELRAPALVEVADAAQDRGDRVDDADRLIARGRAAETVSHLAAPTHNGATHEVGR